MLACMLELSINLLSSYSTCNGKGRRLPIPIRSIDFNFCPIYSKKGRRSHFRDWRGIRTKRIVKCNVFVHPRVLRICNSAPLIHLRSLAQQVNKCSCLRTEGSECTLAASGYRIGIYKDGTDRRTDGQTPPDRCFMPSTNTVSVIEWLWVKCGIAECGMQKVKCGMNDTINKMQRVARVRLRADTCHYFTK